MFYLETILYDKTFLIKQFEIKKKIDIDIVLINCI